MDHPILDFAALRPEWRLLVVCARTSLDPALESSVSELLELPMDWEYIQSESFRHGVFPLLYKILGTGTHGKMPSAVAARFRKAFQEHVLRCLLLSGRLVQVLKTLESNGIRAIPFKGPSMASRLYGDICMRQYSDLDILVSREDLEKAKVLLLREGFVGKEGVVGPLQGAFLAEPRCHLSLFSEKGGIVVELHYDINYTYFSPRFSAELFWKDLHWEEFEKRTILSPSSESMLLYLCVHGASHYWERLGWISDVAELARMEDFNWGKLVALATEVHCRKILSLGLVLAHTLLQAPIPATALPGGEEPAYARRTALSVVNAWFREPKHHRDKFMRRFFYLKMTDRRQDQVEQLREMATPTQRSGSLRTLPHGPFLIHLAFRMVQMAARACLAVAERIELWMGWR